MANSGQLNAQLDIDQILLEAQHRWLRPAEICEILRNYKKFCLYPEPPNRPPSGSLFVFDRNVIQHFRQDGYSWMKEANEKLKVGRIDALKCYYAHGEEDQNFQRRSYWMLKELSHLVFVHYLVVKENRTNFKCYRESEVIPDSQKPRENIHNSQVESSVFSEIQPNSYEGTLQVTDPASLDSAHASEFENAELVYCHQQSPGFQSFDNVMQPVVQKMRDGSIPYCDVPISDLKMSFNPAALLASIKQKAKRKVPIPSKGKKRGREPSSSKIPSGLGQSSKGPTPRPQPSPRLLSRASTPLRVPEIIDPEGDALLLQSMLEDHTRCPLIPSLVAKYQDEVDPGEGVRSLELIMLKALSMVRGLAMKSLGSSSKVAELDAQNKEKEKRIRELEVELNQERIKINEAYDWTREAKDDAEMAKLELIQAKKEFEAQLVNARAQAVEEFKKSKDYEAQLGQYGSGSYFYALQLARSFLRTKLPDDMKQVVEELKSVNKLVGVLELSSSNVEGDEEGLEEVDTPDEVNSIDITVVDLYWN